MKFKVLIKVVYLAKYADGELAFKEGQSYVKSKKIGLNLINELKLNAETVENEVIQEIQYYVSGDCRHDKNLFIELNQKEAEKSEKFKNTNCIEITVDYKITETLFDVVLENGKLVYKFNNEKAKQIWIDNNYSDEILDQENFKKYSDYRTKEKEKEEKRQEEEKMYQERRKKEEEKERINKEKEQEEKQKQEEERINWIKEHGSDYLKNCLNNNIKAYPEYITERAEKEFPDFEIDIDDVASWKELYSPSEKALNSFIEYKKQYPELKIELVYLERDKDENHPREAVVIRNYFGYDLINVITYITDNEY